jgi:MoaA/NifB/PqqE/SkfB family radical SAM enzyme
LGSYPRKMRVNEILRAWRKIVTGTKPTLSIEITRECPLRCPGCYAYEDAHLGGDINLRQLPDSKGQELIARTLELVDHHKPLHLSIVGGDPLVRYRELEILLPKLSERGIHVQVVTSAFRPMSLEWAKIPRLTIAVSVDGLPPEHDVRRKPATYERILKNIVGHQVTVHCTITGQMMKRPGYLGEFVDFWSRQAAVKRIWMSMFTPQRGDFPPERLTPAERVQAVNDLRKILRRQPKLEMHERALAAFLDPPDSPKDCIFAQTTQTFSADFKTEITPCQFGGDPDCSQCGCYASMGLKAVGTHKLAGLLPVSALFQASLRAGRLAQRFVLSRDHEGAVFP